MFKIMLKKDNENKLISLPCKFVIDFRKEEIPEDYTLTFLAENGSKLENIFIDVSAPCKFDFYTDKRICNNVKFITHMENTNLQRKHFLLNTKDSTSFSIVIPHKFNEYLFTEIELFSAKEMY